MQSINQPITKDLIAQHGLSDQECKRGVERLEGSVYVER